MKTEELLRDLIIRTKDNLSRVEKLKDLTDSEMNFKPGLDSWSVLECIEHLNRYGNFYLPEIEKSIKSSKHKNTGIFNSGWIGNYFALSLLPKDKLNKMKTFPSMNPTGSDLNKSVLDKFIHQQLKMLELLEKAGETDLNKTKTAISKTNWIKLRLGDTFRVAIYHNQRHIHQAEKVLEVINR